MAKADIKSMNLGELTALVKHLGQPAFRGKQIFSWIAQGAERIADMTDLSKDLRQKLEDCCDYFIPVLVKKQVSAVDGTRKYLWKLRDGQMVESVLMQYHHGNTACVSSQVGCRMGCTFCASGIGGLVRNLTAGEILDQVIYMQKEAGLKVGNIVLMGTGEPLDNYDNVLRFIHLVNHENGLCIGQRHISLSTSGLVEGIERLAAENLQITLSISLHSAENVARSSIMPVNNRYPIEVLLAACRSYFQKTGRRISYEYAMIAGISDGENQARRLCTLLRGQPSHVNLIPLNEVKESGLKASSRQAVATFQRILEQGGLSATVRRTLGPDIDASCGQLRQRTVEEEGHEGLGQHP